jgi:hypothetical protein
MSRYLSFRDRKQNWIYRTGFHLNIQNLRWCKPTNHGNIPKRPDGSRYMPQTSTPSSCVIDVGKTPLHPLIWRFRNVHIGLMHARYLIFGSSSLFLVPPGVSHCFENPLALHMLNAGRLCYPPRSQSVRFHCSLFPNPMVAKSSRWLTACLGM